MKEPKKFSDFKLDNASDYLDEIISEMNEYEFIDGVKEKVSYQEDNENEENSSNPFNSKSKGFLDMPGTTFSSVQKFSKRRRDESEWNDYNDADLIEDRKNDLNLLSSYLPKRKIRAILNNKYNIDDEEFINDVYSLAYKNKWKEIDLEQWLLNPENVMRMCKSNRYSSSVSRKFANKFNEEEEGAMNNKNKSLNLSPYSDNELLIPNRNNMQLDHNALYRQLGLLPGGTIGYVDGISFLEKSINSIKESMRSIVVEENYKQLQFDYQTEVLKNHINMSLGIYPNRGQTKKTFKNKTYFDTDQDNDNYSENEEEISMYNEYNPIGYKNEIDKKMEDFDNEFKFAQIKQEEKLKAIDKKITDSFKDFNDRFQDFLSQNHLNNEQYLYENKKMKEELLRLQEQIANRQPGEPINNDELNQIREELNNLKKEAQNNKIDKSLIINEENGINDLNKDLDNFESQEKQFNNRNKNNYNNKYGYENKRNNKRNPKKRNNGFFATKPVNFQRIDATPTDNQDFFNTIDANDNILDDVMNNMNHNSDGFETNQYNANYSGNFNNESQYQQEINQGQNFKNRLDQLEKLIKNSIEELKELDEIIEPEEQGESKEKINQSINLFEDVIQENN